MTRLNPDYKQYKTDQDFINAKNLIDWSWWYKAQTNYTLTKILETELNQYQRSLIIKILQDRELEKKLYELQMKHTHTEKLTR